MMSPDPTNKKGIGGPSLPTDPLLFGHDDTPGIVAVEEGDPGEMVIWRRRPGEKRTLREEVEFKPFLLISDETLLKGFTSVSDVIPLSGKGFYRYMVRLPSFRDLSRLVNHLRRVTGLTPSRTEAPYLYLKDPALQYLLDSGRTLFKGMNGDDVVSMALDIETWCHPDYEFPNPDRPEDRIISIAVADNRGREEIIDGHKLDEGDMLRRLAEIFHETDPDVILGHNIFKFDISYIAARASLFGIPLNWGRDGRGLGMRRSRVSIAERVFDYPKWTIYGRHVLDTYILTLFYDLTNRNLDSYSLKGVARALGVAGEDRTYLEGGRLNWYFENKPKLLAKYNLEDSRETLALGRLLGGVYFVESQIFPYSLQDTVVRGAATKINSLMLREYLRRGKALPSSPGERGDLAGGHTALLEKGIIRNVYHCDVRSLYPSIILSKKIKPAADTLKVFLPMLETLTDYRLRAKKVSSKARDKPAGQYLESLQATFKILINSFYGYLASGRHNFSDLKAAARITAAGRRIIRLMMKHLEGMGCRIVEVDTDGIFFHVPGRPFSGKEGRRLVGEISTVLPEGIMLELDGLYPRMFSYKTKNYALLDKDGRLVIRGSGLKSRGVEPYLRNYLREAIELAFQGRSGKIEKLYLSLREKIEKHQVPIGELAKTETLVDSLPLYQQKVQAKKRNPKASYELAAASGRDHKPGDQITFYITGDQAKVTAYQDCRLMSEWDARHPDENTAYYLAKLADFDGKFRLLLTEPTA
jgi:DNA polymerase I